MVDMETLYHDLREIVSEYDIQILTARSPETEKLIETCAEIIKMYGELRYCSGGACACMGCVNHKMSKSDYEYALTLPEVKAMLDNPNLLWPKKELTLYQCLQLHEGTKRGKI